MGLRWHNRVKQLKEDIYRNAQKRLPCIVFYLCQRPVSLQAVCMEKSLCKRWADKALYGKADSLYKRHLIIISAALAAYWALALAILFIPDHSADNSFIILLFAAVIYFAALLIYNRVKENIGRLSKQEGKLISSMAFFHIPLQEYREAYELYESGSDRVKYFFGENGETMIDKVCCSDYPSKLFDTAVELGSTKAMFCGHDHYNNLSVEYQGIRLTYGMSIDYLAMPGIENDTAQRGGTLITLHGDSEFDIEQVRLADIA